MESDSQNLLAIAARIENYGNNSPEKLQYLLLTRVNTMPIVEEIKEKIIHNIEKIKDPAKQKKDLENACIILDVVQSTALNHATELVKGAHVVVKDGGALYNVLEQKKLIEPRPSSHYKGDKKKQDASMQAGEIFRELLIGQTKDGKTWFQLESHSLGGIKNLIGHLIDFVKYRISSKNVGQYGLSKHVDSNPIMANEQDGKVKFEYDHEKINQRQKKFDADFEKKMQNKKPEITRYSTNKVRSLRR